MTPVTGLTLAKPISRPAVGCHPLGRPPATAATAPAAADPSAASPSAASRSASSPAEPLPAHVLADIAAGIAAATPLWSEAVRHDPDGRQPVRLIATERYEVWVIGWTIGQSVRVHDHGDSAGAFVVTDGELTEVLPDGRGGRVERALATGRRRDLPVGLVHDVVNRKPAPATSIHVYSPPITHMTFYDDTFTRIETETVPPEHPLLGAAAATRALHPVGPRPS
jgi:predicted metal-dependent enzyme (double-stranded beta helix superfamily)